MSQQAATRRRIPLPVQRARQALARLAREDADKAAALQKSLPAYALAQEKAGAKITVASLLAAARTGIDAAPRRSPPRKTDALAAYNDVVAAFPPPAESSLYPVYGHEITEKFIIACELGYLGTVLTLHKSGKVNSFALEHGHAAAMNNRQMAVCLNLDSLSGKSPIDAAARALLLGYPDYLKQLHKTHINLFSDPEDLKFALYSADTVADHAAINMAGQRECLEYLKSQDFDLSAIGLFHVRGLDNVRYLHRNGAPIESASPWHAVETGDLPLLAYLHENGFSLRAEPKEAWAPGHHGHLFWIAVGKGYDDIADYLREKSIVSKFDTFINSEYAEGAGITYNACAYALREGLANARDLLNDNGKRWARNEEHAVIRLLEKHDTARHFKSFMRHNMDAVQMGEYARYVAREELWQQQVRLSPPEWLAPLSPRFYRQGAFDALNEIFKKDASGAPHYAYHTAALFGTPARALQYLKRWGTYGKMPLHDITHMIRIPDGGAPNLKDWGDAVLKCGPSMAKLVKFADKLPSPMKSSDVRTWSYQNTLAAVAKFAFNRAAEHPELAALCLRHTTTEDAFDDALDLVQSGAAARKNLPDIRIDGDDFDMPGAVFRLLPANDIRILFAGEETDCCQSIGSAGEDCAAHAWTSENGGIYAVEDSKGRIIGQTWAWRGTLGELCFDSLETLGGRVSPTAWQKILERTGVLLSQDNPHGIKRFLVGLNGATPAHIARVFHAAAERAIPRDYSADGYTDAQKQCFVWSSIKLKRH